jgi:hypothetical protein
MSNLNTFVGVIAFYVFLACILFPVVFYYAFNRSLVTAGNGYVAGSLLSIVLWFVYGNKLVGA